jgi:hypothetical protein
MEGDIMKFVLLIFAINFVLFLGACSNTGKTAEVLKFPFPKNPVGSGCQFSTSSGGCVNALYAFHTPLAENEVFLGMSSDGTNLYLMTKKDLGGLGKRYLIFLSQSDFKGWSLACQFVDDGQFGDGTLAADSNYFYLLKYGRSALRLFSKSTCTETSTIPFGGSYNGNFAIFQNTVFSAAAGANATQPYVWDFFGDILIRYPAYLTINLNRYSWFTDNLGVAINATAIYGAFLTDGNYPIILWKMRYANGQPLSSVSLRTSTGGLHFAGRPALLTNQRLAVVDSFTNFNSSGSRDLNFYILDISGF